MPGDAASTERIDYLQRSGSVPEVATAERTSGAPASRRLLRVAGIGRPDKYDGQGPSRPEDPERRWRPPTAELITGLYGYRVPLAFEVVGGPEGVQVQLGTWSAREAAGEAQDRRIRMMESVLRGLYPVVDAGLVPSAPRSWPLSGIALGVPSPRGIDRTDGAAPLDRIIRSMTGTAWSLLVLAYPVSEEAIGDVRSSILNEMRAVGAVAEQDRAPSPLTEQYVELLKAGLGSAGGGMATGAWRTAVYLLGEGDSYPGLASAWRSVMSGERSLPEPVRVFDDPRAGAWAQEWALPDAWGVPGPGFYRRPFEAQTLLSTAELASVLHLPEIETPGFGVDLAPRFDVVARRAGSNGAGLRIGEVLHNRRPTGSSYEVSRKALTRHVFVAGLTGSGKTNTIMALLEETAAADVPFLVIEPTKAEYRALITHPHWGERVRVFTAGKATVAPFTLNPFEVPPGTGVSEHLDLLRAAFSAAFGMWTPLPQILERCLHDVYTDRGWDLRTNTNARLAETDAADEAFPTLSDVVAKVDEVVQDLGYEEKIAGDMRAALLTRLESLRQGGKGAMLDVARSLPDEELFGHPTVIELEALGDEGDKALVTGLLLIRLAEYRRTQGQSPDLVHMLVVEEAHRLLANVGTGGGEGVADPRGQAVETFSNLLSEIRAYGQGVVIADQVPVRLAPDVMKNTNLKIAHRIVSGDDRAALAGAMSMDERQARALTALDVGEAAVFSGGDDAPLLVRIPLAKDPLSPVPPSDEQVREHTARWQTEGGYDSLFLARPFCAQTCATDEACAAARRLAADEYVQRALSRLVVSTIDEPSAMARLWDDLAGVVRARRPPDVDEDELLRAFAGHGSDWFAGRRGAQGVWSYAATAGLRDTLRAALLEQVEQGEAGQEALWALRQQAMQLHERRYEPYPACDVVCAQDPPLCLYRSAVADLVASRRYDDGWHETDDADAEDEERRRRATWDLCLDAAYELVEFPDDDQPEEARVTLDLSARRVGACFEQQMLAGDRRKVPRTSLRILNRVLREARFSYEQDSASWPGPGADGTEEPT
jgi:Helicase HerA, central domain